MKKVILSVLMSIALTASFSVMAQDTVKKDNKDAKQKTECTKTCTKDKKECDKAETKACCTKDKECTKKEAKAETKTCCSKEKKS